MSFYRQKRLSASCIVEVFVAGSDGKNPLGKEAPEAVDDLAFLTGVAETFSQSID